MKQINPKIIQQCKIEMSTLNYNLTFRNFLISNVIKENKSGDLKNSQYNRFRQNKYIDQIKQTIHIYTQPQETKQKQRISTKHQRKSNTTRKNTHSISGINYEYHIKGNSINQLWLSLQKLSYSKQKKLTHKQNLYQQLLSIWKKKNIPVCHQKFIISLMNESEIDQFRLIANEIKKLKKADCLIINIVQQVKKRQQCKRNLRTFVDHIKMLNKKNNESLYQDSFIIIEGLIQDLKVLNLSIIQNLLKWREDITFLYRNYNKSTKQKIIFYLKQNQKENNYLIKILKDNAFIYSSHLFPQSIYPDPFFLSIKTKYPTDQLYFKIRASELLLLQQLLI